MIEVELSTLNYWAVLVSALAMFFLGAVWYSPAMFARAWMEAHGYSQDDLQAMQKGMGPSYGLAFLSYAVMAFVLAVLIQGMGIEGPAEAAVLGVLVWLGFMATTGLTAYLFSNRKPMTFVIDTLYPLAGILIMGLILGAWP